MTKIELQLLKIARAFICGTRANDIDILTPTEWDSLYSLCYTHRFTAAAYVCLRGTPAFCAAPEALQNSWKRTAAYLSIVQVQRSNTLCALCRELEDAGISYAVVKGIACRSLFTYGDMRVSADEDIFVDSRNAKKALRICVKSGFHVSERRDGTLLLTDVRKMHIHLHTRLFPTEYQALNRHFADALQRRRRLETPCGAVYTLGHTDQILYILAHMLRYFVSSGISIRTACDAAAYIRCWGDAVDWDTVHSMLDITGAGTLFLGVLDVCRRYLLISVNAFNCPKQYVDCSVSGASLLDDMLRADVYGQKERIPEGRAGFKAAIIGPSGGIVRAVFPGQMRLKAQYTYLERHPWLIPVAWLSRIAHYSRTLLRRRHYSDGMVIRLQRDDLLKAYNVVLPG
jgi:hypothetical protein